MTDTDKLAALLPECDAAWARAWHENMNSNATNMEPLPGKSEWKARWLTERGVVVDGPVMFTHSDSRLVAHKKHDECHKEGPHHVDGCGRMKPPIEPSEAAIEPQPCDDYEVSAFEDHVRVRPIPGCHPGRLAAWVCAALGHYRAQFTQETGDK